MIFAQSTELVLSPTLIELLFHTVRFLCFNVIFILLLKVI